MSEARHDENTNTVHGVAIIGAGFGGLGLGIRLRQQGVEDFVVYEKAADVGGVWRDNVYPGAACDVPSHLYSFSFEPNPDWRRSFGSQVEIQDYLRRCAEKYRLREKIVFKAAVQAMAFDSASGLWRMDFADGRRRHARAVVLAVGALNIPQYPAIPGMEAFGGKLMHTAEWDTDYDIAGKRVAVIGTGASAIQVLPAIQPQVKSLTLFQRTPPWIMPKFDRPIGPRQRRWFHRLPLLQRMMRGLQYLLGESVAPAFLWDSFLTRFGEWVALRYLRRRIPDPALRDMLTPDYSIGCKRVLLTDDYYPALVRDNVQVVTAGIERIDAEAVYTRDGQRHAADAIVLATGFKVPVAGAPFEIRGLDGRRLNDDWAAGSEAYKGMAVSGYPNLLYIMGPNTGPGNTSVIFYIESQINYILQYLQQLRSRGLSYLDLKPEVQRAFNEAIQRRMRGTTWTSGCQSWYLTEDGRNTTLWPGFSWQYRLATRRFSPGDYACVYREVGEAPSPSGLELPSAGAKP